MNNYANIKEGISKIIESIINLINHPKTKVEDCAYFYRTKDKNNFLIYIYLYKLIINSKDYLEDKFNQYVSKYPDRVPLDTKKVSNISSKDELELLLIVQEKATNEDFYYNEINERIYFQDNSFVEARFLLTLVSILLDKNTNEGLKQMNICYTIPNRDISKVTNEEDLSDFIESFTYYNIKVKQTDKTKIARENNILIIKNAAIHYLKHLKQFKHGLENEETYKIFYNLLVSECQKEGFELTEEKKNLIETDQKLLDKIASYIDDNFYKAPLSKQTHLVENIVWQSSNDINLLEHMNSYLDNLIDLITNIRIGPKEKYESLRERTNVNDIKLLLVLTTFKYLLTYHNPSEKIDYGLIDLTNIKPQYMNSIYSQTEQDLKVSINNMTKDLAASKKKLEQYKQDRQELDMKDLSPEKYQKELELCVSKLNQESIIIARLNSTIAALKKEYEDLKKDQSKKYRNVELYNYNHSIITHISNAIIGCSFYLKTNNTKEPFENIIIFEDYEKTDNSFYLEITFKELLRLSNQHYLNGIIEQNDLPKLA